MIINNENIKNFKRLVKKLDDRKQFNHHRSILNSITHDSVEIIDSDKTVVPVEEKSKKVSISPVSKKSAKSVSEPKKSKEPKEPKKSKESSVVSEQNESNEPSKVEFVLKITEPCDCGSDPTKPTTSTETLSQQQLEERISDIFEKKFEKFCNKKEKVGKKSENSKVCKENVDFNDVKSMIIQQMFTNVVQDTHYDENDTKITLSKSINGKVKSQKRTNVKMESFIETVVQTAKFHKDNQEFLQQVKTIAENENVNPFEKAPKEKAPKEKAPKEKAPKEKVDGEMSMYKLKNMVKLLKIKGYTTFSREQLEYAVKYQQSPSK